MLDYLPTRAEERIRACGGFKDKRRLVPYNNNLRFELGMVSYNGTGKYRETDVVAPWSDIPEYVGGWVIVICMYQLMWDIPSAWQVRVIPISRM